MRLRFLRGACVIVTAGNIRILMDPWLTDGEYYGSWAQYPPFTDRIEDLKYDYIYVSHIHPDHFSPETMKRLNKKIVLIHEFQSKFLRRNIEALGFDVFELPHGRRTAIGGGANITIHAADDCRPDVCGKFFSCSSPLVQNTQIDSLCVIEGDGKVWVNANDCPYELAIPVIKKIKDTYDSIDLLLVAYGGAGPYPQCFKMSDDAKIVRASAKARRFIDHATMFAHDIGAKRTFPFAGDYVLSSRLAKLNKYRGVPDVEQVHTVFEKYRLSTLKLNPGQERDITDDDNDLEPINQVDKKKYIRYILEPRPMDYDTDPDPDPADLRDLATEAIAHMGQKAKELGLISDTRLLITLGDKDTVCWNPDGSNELRMTVDPKLLKRLLMGPKWAHWNNAEIGSHIQFERIPDVFERGLHHIVSFLHV